MKHALLMLATVLSVSTAVAEVFPYVQEHLFELEPYMQRTSGYAVFVASNNFDGSEKVTFSCPPGVLLPDIKTSGRTLTAFSSGQWYSSDKERVLSATRGNLPQGTYSVDIEWEDGRRASIPLTYQSHFLAPATSFDVQDEGDSVSVSWLGALGADTFWVFVFPVNTTSILDDLIPVSSVMHTSRSHRFSKARLEPGEYKIAIRSNQIWEAGTNWGFGAETWSLSSESFLVP